MSFDYHPVIYQDIENSNLFTKEEKEWMLKNSTDGYWRVRGNYYFEMYEYDDIHKDFAEYRKYYPEYATDHKNGVYVHMRATPKVKILDLFTSTAAFVDNITKSNLENGDYWFDYENLYVGDFEHGNLKLVREFNVRPYHTLITQRIRELRDKRDHYVEIGDDENAKRCSNDLKYCKITMSTEYGI